MTTTRPRVLVIEDNPDCRESLLLLLSFCGYETLGSATGVDGLRLALEWRPEVIISDIGLPEMDGWEVGRRTRAALGQKVLLIALTGYGQPADEENSMAAGFDVHLTKPAEVEVLLHLLAGGRC
jgi:CheY-like chemotaxis protein